MTMIMFWCGFCKHNAYVQSYLSCNFRALIRHLGQIGRSVMHTYSDKDSRRHMQLYIDANVISTHMHAHNRTIPFRFIESIEKGSG